MYSWSGNPKPNSNFHDTRPSSLLSHEIRDNREFQTANCEEYTNLLDFNIDLPLIQYENEDVNSFSKINYPPK